MGKVMFCDSCNIIIKPTQKIFKVIVSQGHYSSAVFEYKSVDEAELCTMCALETRRSLLRKPESDE